MAGIKRGLTFRVTQPKFASFLAVIDLYAHGAHFRYERVLLERSIERARKQGSLRKRRKHRQPQKVSAGQVEHTFSVVEPEGNLGRLVITTSTHRIRLSGWSKGRWKPFTKDTAHFKGLTEAINPKPQHAHCSEFQLFNQVHASGWLTQPQRRTLGGRPRLVHMFLYTDRAPCESCTSVIAEFLEHYPVVGRLFIEHTVSDALKGLRSSWDSLGERKPVLKQTNPVKPVEEHGLTGGS